MGMPWERLKWPDPDEFWRPPVFQFNEDEHERLLDVLELDGDAGRGFVDVLEQPIATHLALIHYLDEERYDQMLWMT